MLYGKKGSECVQAPQSEYLDVPRFGYTAGARLWNFVWMGAIGALCWYGNYTFTASSFEKERFFSHLSDMEREMSFRSEMGLYYSYYKRIVDAPTFSSGMSILLQDNQTEFPSTINVISRFNIFPEILISGLFRMYRNILLGMNSTGMECFAINRGNRSTVTSCEGLGVPVYFYLEAIWICAGFSSFLLFAYGVLLSQSLGGGLLTTLLFFFNHSECTRVQWTPPLRESFAYPVLLFHCFLVTMFLQECETERRITFRRPWRGQLVTVTSCASLMLWQFSQIFLACEALIFVTMYAVGNIDKATSRSLLSSLTIGHILAIFFLMGNSMLTFSFLSSILVSSWMLLTFDSRVKYHSFTWKSSLRVGFVLGLCVFLKLALPGDKQDSHISSMFLSKIGIQSRNFHTSLYICAPEFQSISWEYVKNISKSLLLPYSLASLLAVAYLWIRRIPGLDPHTSALKISPGFQTNRSYQAENLQLGASSIDVQNSPFIKPAMSYVEPYIVFNLLLMLLYVVMALVAMRLKLFLTPQLCILVSLLASEKVFASVFNSMPTKTVHSLILILLISLMSKPGFEFLQARFSVSGEYSNYPLEDLLSWVKDYTPVNAAFAGPMPIMASILLSTGRPIVNHPHYEDMDVRRRTQDVYSVFSKKPPYDAFVVLHDLRVDYVVLSSDKCFHGKHKRNGCAMTEIWDLVDPENKSRPPLCPQLFYNDPVPSPFLRVYKSREYVILQVPSFDDS